MQKSPIAAVIKLPQQPAAAADAKPGKSALDAIETVAAALNAKPSAPQRKRKRSAQDALSSAFF